MKIPVVLITVTALGAVAAVSHRHGHLHNKKNVDVKTITDITTITVAEAIVWVDEKGDPVTTEFAVAAMTSASASSISSSSSVASTTSSSDASASTISHISVSPISSISTAAIDPPASSDLAPASSATVSTSAAELPTATSVSEAAAATSVTSTEANNNRNGPAQTSVSDSPKIGTNGGLGIAYDAFDSTGACKAAAEMAADVGALAGLGYTSIRVYDTSCNQVAVVAAAAAASGLSVFAGLGTLINLQANLEDIISQAGANLNAIQTIGICNECVNNGVATSGQVVTALDQARAYLATTAYKGFVVTVDVFSQFYSHPELCAASDYCAANCHAFFDAQVAAGAAGPYVLDQMAAIAQNANGKPVVITESGWPYLGQANGAAVPSLADQQAAIASLKAAFQTNLYLFEAYDASYKAPGAFGVEPYWGIYGH